MGILNFRSGSSKSKFDEEMAEISRQLILSLGKIQEGMRIYLKRYCHAHGIRTDAKTEEETFGWLEFARKPSPEHFDLAREYVDIIKSHPIVKQAFSTAMVFQINSMTSKGLMSEAMKIADNLNRLGLPAFSLSMTLPDEKSFIKTANEFYENSKTIEVVSGSLGFAQGHERYRIDSELGRGSFGVVFEAYDNRLRRKVAIKRLKTTIHDRATHNYESEAQKIAQLNHPGIVQVYDLERAPDGIRIVMEYVNGGSLRGLLESNGGALTEAAACSIFRQLCRAMAHAHKQGIIHRDIKPENIFVCNTPSVTVKVGDFGLALISGVQTMAASGYSGTPLYMAPEQTQPGAVITPATDVYAMGKILHEMLTGELGLIVDTESASCPYCYRRVIARSVEREAIKRYKDASELLDAFEYEALRKGQ